MEAKLQATRGHRSRPVLECQEGHAANEAADEREYEQGKQHQRTSVTPSNMSAGR